jgi:hypothetical protein
VAADTGVAVEVIGEEVELHTSNRRNHRQFGLEQYRSLAFDLDNQRNDHAEQPT